MLNKAILCGRLTRDPETSATTGGTEVSKFSLAIPRRFNRDETDFLNVVTFGKTAEFVSKYFQKGSVAIVVGSIQTRSYEKDGQKRYVTEIIADEVNFGASKKESASGESSESVSGDEAISALEEMRNGFSAVEDDDDLPF